MLLFNIAYTSSCQKKQNKTIIIHNHVSNSKKLNTIQSDSIKIIQLPAGSDLIVKYFKNIDINQRITNKERDLLYDYIYTISNKVYKNTNTLNNFYKYSKINNYDFDYPYIKDLNHIKIDSNFYGLYCRLPNIGKNEIFIFNSLNKDNINDYDIQDPIDLIVYNKDSGVISSINLSHCAYFNAIGAYTYSAKNSNYFWGIPSKYFYIDKKYIIHIKYFLSEEMVSENENNNDRVIAHIQYKILLDGSIVRYFDQNQGYYKSIIEEGNIKENTKEGLWIEYLGGNTQMYAEVNYESGKVKRNITIYEIRKGIKTRKILYIIKITDNQLINIYVAPYNNMQ